MVKNLPARLESPDRRTLLKWLAGAAATGLNSMHGSGAASSPSWSRVRRSFLLKPGLVMLNAANLCPAPRNVLARLVEATRDVDINPAYQNRLKYRELREVSRSKVAAYLGAEPSEIALVRNTSEGNNVVVSGLDLGPGDEVVIWSENHATNNIAWKVRAKRLGFTVREVATPTDLTSPTDLLEAFEAKINSRTRVAAITHVSNLSGIQLPIKEICRRARERSIFTLVDGAQTFGALDLNLHEIGCDFFTGSAHKWFMGPREVGVLYVRQGLAPKLWPLSVGIGWEKARDQDALRFETLGQRDDAAVAALADTVDFHQGIGKRSIENRVRQMASHLHRKLSQKKKAKLITPQDPRMRAGVVVFSLTNVEPAKAVETLYEEHHIGCAAMNVPSSPPGIRFSPHIYNSNEDLEFALNVLARAFAV